MKGPAIYDADEIGELTPVQLRRKLNEEHGFDRDLNVPLASRRYWTDDADEAGEGGAWRMEYIQP